MSSHSPLNVPLKRPFPDDLLARLSTQRKLGAEVTYVPYGFTNDQVDPKYLYHTSLPYALLKHHSFGIKKNGDLWEGFVCGNFGGEKVTPESKRPFHVYTMGYAIPSVALNEAIKLAISKGVLLALDRSSSVGRKVTITSPMSACVFFAGAVVDVQEEFMVGGELYFRVKWTDIEDYIPAACTTPLYR